MEIYTLAGKPVDTLSDVGEDAVPPAWQNSIKKGQTKFRVLLIDNNASDCDTVIEMLDGHYEIVTASSGAEGVELFNTYRPDCVLLDYRLPDTSGIAIIGELKRFDPHACLIMLTAHGDESIAAEAMRYGAYYYISKDTADAGVLNHYITNALLFSKSQRKHDVQNLLLENCTNVLAQEITEPLNTMRRYLRAISGDRNSQLSEATREALQSVNDIMDNLQKTAHYFGEYSALDGLNVTQEVSLVDLVEDIMRNLAYESHKEHVSFSYRELPTIQANHWKCNLVLQSLCDFLIHVIEDTHETDVFISAIERLEGTTVSMRIPSQAMSFVTLQTMQWVLERQDFSTQLHEYPKEFMPYLLCSAMATYCKESFTISEESGHVVIRYRFQ